MVTARDFKPTEFKCGIWRVAYDFGAMLWEVSKSGHIYHYYSGSVDSGPHGFLENLAYLINEEERKESEVYPIGHEWG